jgi:hypothetical protein
MQFDPLAARQTSNGNFAAGLKIEFAIATQDQTGAVVARDQPITALGRATGVAITLGTQNAKITERL